MLVRYTGPDRLIPVSDRTENGLTIKQKVRVGVIAVDRESIRCPLTVLAYAVGPDGAYGEAYPTTFIRPYSREIVANNLTAVRGDGSLAYTHLRGCVVRNYATGQQEEIPAVPGLSDEEQFQAFLAAAHDTYYLQGEEFAQKQDEAPVPLWPLAVHHVQQADAMGYFNGPQ